MAVVKAQGSRRTVQRRGPEAQYALRVRRGSAVWVAVPIAVLGVAVALYAAVSVYVADTLSRPPRTAVVGTPADVGLSYEAVEFRSIEDRLLLRGWWMPASPDAEAGAPETARAVILVHGRGSTRSASDGLLLSQAQALVSAGYSVLSFDLRAHGQSGGTRYSLGPLERRDVGGAVAYVRSRGVPAGRVGLVCHSMGAAVCLLAAPDLPDVSAVVADSAFASLADLLLVELPRASGLPVAFNPGILMAGKLFFSVDVAEAQPERVVARMRPRPVLFIHGEADERIPMDHSRRLWRASGESPDLLWLVPGVAHDKAFVVAREEYVARMLRLFDIGGL